MSLGPGEQVNPASLAELYLPRDPSGEIIPQTEYVIVHPFTAHELDGAAGFTFRDTRLLPMCFDTVQGDPYFWALRDNGDQDPVTILGMSGITYAGRLPLDDGRVLPVLAFMYSNGKTETAERVVAAEVFGEGVLHPGHVGQRRSPYIVGADIARRDPVSGQISHLEPSAQAIKHFAMSCIDAGSDPNWRV